jgi:hypothetical protein
MRRAAILIGVSSTEGLPKLQAVESGIALMQEWATGQKIEGDRLIILTDRSDPVRAFQIADAINSLVQRRDIDQLIVYFSGHGIHNRGDIWLLSGAPKLGSEAVNVEASIQAARSCGISHVVIIADACRVAAEGIQGLNVQGIDIFPNEPVDGRERPVDAYFACARGKPALEVRDVAEAARGFSGLYTEVLAECLAGMHSDALHITEENGVEVAHVPVWNLADKLEAEVPARLKAKLGRTPTINQTPVARITSRKSWVSRLFPFQSMPSRHDYVDVLGCSAGEELSAFDAADQVFKSMLFGETDALDNGVLGGADDERDWGGALFLSTAADLAVPLRPGHRTMRCGIALRGMSAFRVHGCRVRWTVDDRGRQVEIDLNDKPVIVLLELENGDGVLVPVISGFIAHLRFKEGELAHLAYEPAISSSGFAYWREHKESRAVLATVAAAAGMGVLRVKGPAAAMLRRSLNMHRKADLSLALYAAYAYHDSGQRHRVGMLNTLLRKQFGFVFHDLALLAGRGALRQAQERGNVLSAIPMLSRGWLLLNVFGAELPPVLAELQANLQPSLWTLLNPAGTQFLVRAIDDERIAL